ncbi:MAG: prepilin-type N-terminal cleavage/methylation domain-containing protein [Chitinispirillaceae bacterium]|jgi:prepilin-type N-terminal cleavage/methylation domain-containing protein
MSRKEKGFTLVEVIVVAVIVATLSAFAIPLYMGYVKDSRINVGNGIAGTISTAAAASTQEKIVFDVVNGPSPPEPAAPLSINFKSFYDANVPNTIIIPGGYTLVWSDPNPGTGTGTGTVLVYFTDYGPSTAKTFTYKQ